MAVLKCKMCGGNLEVQEGMTICECEYCGSTQTIPNVDDEKKVTLFTRANRLRSDCEFDKAFGIYESIVTEFQEEAEAYWGLILCKYGIEYVDDPRTGKKIPTCHRSSFDSVMDDPNFEMVMECSDAVSRAIYREEAKAIEALRASIIEVSSKEEPYDIFICYKETDLAGGRTIDSVIAQDVYDALVEKGYKVFFSRITLEDKLGQEYEPYIFAALNSAKVMLAFGTDYEYYNSVWVKNEWSRFLSMIQKGEKKTLIPCYKGIDAYDMPKEFARLQAQDMGKVGAIQDLVRGIGKIIALSGPKIVVDEKINIGSNPNLDSLIKRIFMFLEDEDWKSAIEYSEKVLDIEPENPYAYLGKLLASLHVKRKEDLQYRENPFDNNTAYSRLMSYADDELKQEINSYIEAINSRIKEEKLVDIYNNALEKMANAKSEKEYLELAHIFASIREYKDAAEKETECNECAKKCKMDGALDLAKSKMKTNDPASIEEAIQILESISGWKNADKLISGCKSKVENIKKQKEAERLESIRKETEQAKATKRQTKIRIMAGVVAAIVMLLVIGYNAIFVPGKKYDNAMTLKEAGEYKQALELFRELDDYKDAEDKVEEIAYYLATEAENKGDLKSAAIMYGMCNQNPSAREKSFALWDKIAVRRKEDVGCYYSILLNEDGTVTYSGRAIGGDAGIKEWKDLIAVAGGDWITAGLKNDGTVVAVSDYELPNVSQWKDIVSIAIGNTTIAGLRKDGTVMLDGEHERLEKLRKLVSAWTDIVAIDVSNEEVIGIKTDGSVVSTYIEQFPISNVVQIAAGSAHAVALKKDGTVVPIYGYNADGECDVSDWTDIVAVGAGSYITYGLKSDGTIVYTGGTDYANHFEKVKQWGNVTTISANYLQVIGRCADGTVLELVYDNE